MIILILIILLSNICWYNHYEFLLVILITCFVHSGPLQWIVIVLLTEHDFGVQLHHQFHICQFQYLMWSDQFYIYVSFSFHLSLLYSPHSKPHEIQTNALYQIRITYRRIMERLNFVFFISSAIWTYDVCGKRCMNFKCAFCHWHYSMFFLSSRYFRFCLFLFLWRKFFRSESYKYLVVAALFFLLLHSFSYENTFREWNLYKYIRRIWKWKEIHLVGYECQCDKFMWIDLWLYFSACRFTCIFDMIENILFVIFEKPFVLMFWKFLINDEHGNPSTFRWTISNTSVPLVPYKLWK